ncbi:hypothetical protein TWF694_001961 [Orbilia ellipsospora]|uniref:Clr5 domain-containing protein n=1 Tax=Orbilia ellipsospora TaxID=2528407 RepID=A0AAV9X6R7_9PEZI
MCSKSRRISADEWETHKETIKEYYIIDGMELAECKTTMKRDHGFEASLRQYKNKVTAWGFRKNCGKDEMGAIVLKVVERWDQERKDTMVEFKGKVITRTKMKKWLVREEARQVPMGMPSRFLDPAFYRIYAPAANIKGLYTGSLRDFNFVQRYANSSMFHDNRASHTEPRSNYGIQTRWSTDSLTVNKNFGNSTFYEDQKDSFLDTAGGFNENNIPLTTVDPGSLMIIPSLAQYYQGQISNSTKYHYNSNSRLNSDGEIDIDRTGAFEWCASMLAEEASAEMLRPQDLLGGENQTLDSDFNSPSSFSIEGFSGQDGFADRWKWDEDRDVEMMEDSTGVDMETF